MDAYREANRALWNTWAPLNFASKFYDVEAFAAGRGHDLDPIARAGPGDVRGKSLLHLQCHFGMDTIRWAKHGATVTGVDFSEEAIAAARALAARMGVPATFVHSDVYELPAKLEGRFDVVFTSHGVLNWLPDLERWAQVVARFLAPGGIFYIVEAHPMMNLFNDRLTEPNLQLLYSGGPSRSVRSTAAATARPTRRSRASSTSGCTRCPTSSARSRAPVSVSSPSRSIRSSPGASSPGWKRAPTAGGGCPSTRSYRSGAAAYR
jgi:SAM-dependent methyltransferase